MKDYYSDRQLESIATMQSHFDSGGMEVYPRCLAEEILQLRRALAVKESPDAFTTVTVTVPLNSDESRWLWQHVGELPDHEKVERLIVDEIKDFLQGRIADWHLEAATNGLPVTTTVPGPPAIGSTPLPF